MHKRHNWGKSQIWFPKEIIYPKSLEELRQAIHEAKSKHLKIRLAGSLHSLNALCTTNDIQIHTDKLNQVLFLDEKNLKVKVQGGIKIKTLLSFLAKYNLTLPNQGYIAEQTIAGAIATATHGSGNTGTMSSFVEELELLDANGFLHTLSPSINEHWFSAAVVNLGCLGIVYSLTLRCIPLVKLHLTKVKSDLNTTLKKLPEFLQKYEYFQFFIDPYSNMTLCWLYQKTDEKIKRRLIYNLHWILNKTLAVLSFDFFSPPWWLMPFMIKTYMHTSSLRSCVDFSYRLLSPADEGHYVEEEIAVPFEHFKEALSVTREIINKHSAQKKRIVAVILIRFATSDRYGYLSPAAERKTAYISLITIAKTGYQDLFKEIETSLYQYQGRPHWGKTNFLTQPIVSQLYGTKYLQFSQVQNELDPSCLFLNNYMNIRLRIRD